MIFKYVLAVALGSSVLTGCVVHAEPSVVVYDDHYPPAYRIEHHPRPIIYPQHRYYEPHRFERHNYHNRDHRGHGHHHGRG